MDEYKRNLSNRPAALLTDRWLLLWGLLAAAGILWGGWQKGKFSDPAWRGLVLITLLFFLLLNVRNPCVTSAKVPYLNPIFLPWFAAIRHSRRRRCRAKS